MKHILNNASSSEFRPWVTLDSEGVHYSKPNIVLYYSDGTKDEFWDETIMSQNIVKDSNILIKVDLNNGVEIIGSGVFSQSLIPSIVIPNTVTNIESGAFANCLNLTSVIIPNSVTVIGPGAFQGCSNITSIYCNSINEPCSVNSGTFALAGNLGGTLHIKQGGSIETYPTWMNSAGNLGMSSNGTWTVVDDL